MSENQNPLIFPENLLNKVTISKYHVIEVNDINTTEDLEILINLIYNYPERNFYYFEQKDCNSNPLIEQAKNKNVLLVNEYEYNYYKHPNFKKDFIKIEKTKDGFNWEWEKKVVETTPMFIKFELQISQSERRKLEIEEKIKLEKDMDNNPLLLKPALWGVGIDLSKLPRWAKNVYEKIRQEKE